MRMDKSLHLRHALFITLSEASTGLRGIKLTASTGAQRPHPLNEQKRRTPILQDDKR